MTGGSDVFFWVENLHARYFFGSRDLSRIFLGIKKIRVFFWVLSPSELFVSGIHCDQKLLRYLSLVIFWVGSFDARYFFGSKISGLCIFWGFAIWSSVGPPPSCILRVPPLGGRYLTIFTSTSVNSYQLSRVWVANQSTPKTISTGKYIQS